jgi:hypothetical protein
MIHHINIEARPSRFEVVTTITTDPEVWDAEEAHGLGRVAHTQRRFPARCWSPLSAARAMAQSLSEQYPNIAVTLSRG